jgi:hypothetical protein
MTTCTRCGKTNLDPEYPHTCTPPPALALADELYRYGTLNNPNGAADELCRLYEENEAKDALLRQALECLTYHAPHHDCIDAMAEYERIAEAAITALRERLK